MNVNTSSEYLNTICEGCLSSNRNLAACDGELSKVYYYFIEQTTSDHEVRLCFECEALIKKFVEFKKQLKIARNSFNIKFEKCPVLTSLSTLSVCNIFNITLSVPCDDQPEIQDSLPLIKEEDGCTLQVYVNSNNMDDDEGILESNINTDIENDDNTRLVTERENESVRKRKMIDHVNEKSFQAKNIPPINTTSGMVKKVSVLEKLKTLNMSPDLMENIVLTWEQVEEERQRSLNGTVFTRNRYKCYDCVLGFNLKFKLDNHMKKHDESIGPVQCKICKVRFADLISCSKHETRVHRNRWRCIPCGGTYSLAATCADHVASVHTSTHAAPVHKCTQCDKCEPTYTKLRMHRREHAAPQKCHICGKLLKHKSSLRVHLYRHKGIREFSCEKCEKSFFFRKDLEIHLTTHEKSKLLYCHECDKTFKSMLTYKSHMKYNLKHVKPEQLKQCDICDSKFATKQGLDHHKSAVHLKSDSFRCRREECDFVCSSRSVLRTHYKTQHSDKREVHRNKICHICGKGYTTKRALDCHMRLHTGERPYVCDDVTCGATFAYPSALYNHNKLVHCKRKRGRGKTQAPLADSDVEPSA